MKKNIKIFVCALMLFVSWDLSAQLISLPTTMERLTNKDWDLVFNVQGNYSFKDRYSTTQLTSTLVYNGVTTILTDYFYLSNHIETTFDYSKVGVATNGKYIIFIINGNVIVKEIISLTNTYLEIKNLNSQKTSKYNYNPFSKF